MRISDWSSDVCSSDLDRRSAEAVLPLSVQAAAVERRVLSDVQPAECRAGRRVRHQRRRAPDREGLRRQRQGIRSRLHDLRQRLRGDQRSRTALGHRSEEHTSELQSLMRNSYAVFCLKKKTKKIECTTRTNSTKLILST